MLETVKAIQCSCDNCEEDFLFTGTTFLFLEKETLEACLELDEWVIIDDKHYCSKCHASQQAGLIVLK
jgi:hypothetical protein